jgi:hypothetical protein
MTDEQSAAACLAGAAVLAIGWILSWATDEPKVKKPWKWGDAPLRARVEIEAIVSHVVGVGFLLICGVFAIQHLGLE